MVSRAKKIYILKQEVTMMRIMGGDKRDTKRVRIFIPWAIIQAGRHVYIIFFFHPSFA